MGENTDKSEALESLREFRPRKRCWNHSLYTHSPHVWTIDGESWYCPGAGVEADDRERLHVAEVNSRRGNRV